MRTIIDAPWPGSVVLASFNCKETYCIHNASLQTSWSASVLLATAVNEVSVDTRVVRLPREPTDHHRCHGQQREITEFGHVRRPVSGEYPCGRRSDCLNNAPIPVRAVWWRLSHTGGTVSGSSGTFVFVVIVRVEILFGWVFGRARTCRRGALGGGC